MEGRNQILFWKHVLGHYQSSSYNHFQMGESVSNKYNKYKPFDLQQLKVDLTQIILFSSGTSK